MWFDILKTSNENWAELERKLREFKEAHDNQYQHVREAMHTQNQIIEEQS